MKNRKGPSWAGSLKSFPDPDGREFSAAEAMVDSAISEWYSEKTGSLTPEEASMNKLAPHYVLPALRIRRFRKGREKGGRRQKARYTSK